MRQQRQQQQQQQQQQTTNKQHKYTCIDIKGERESWIP